MAEIFDLDDLTLIPEEATSVSQAVFEEVFEQSTLAEHHEIVTGIHHKTQIPFVGVLGLVGKKIIQCKPDANGNKIPMSEKFWDPELIGDRFEHCAVDVNPLFKLFKKAMKVNPDFFDRLGSEELGVVEMRVAQALKEMLHRLVWFGDKTADTVANAGYLTNGTDIDYFNILNGLWRQIISTDIPTTSKYYVAIPQNAGVSYVAQANLADDFAFELFKSMWSKADSRFKQLIGNGGVKVHMHVTSAIAENWMNFKEDKSLAFTLEKVEGGGLKNFFRNIEIVTRYDWDATIQAYMDNGTTYHLPNRALMTTPGNIPVGTVSTEDLEKLISNYDAYHQVNFMDFALKLDAKFLQDYLAVAAY